MTDRELLELAAKAAGMTDWRWNEYSQSHCHYNVQMNTWYHDSYGDRIEWTPLTDDGDALRLAVKLKIDTMIESELHDGTPVISVIYPLDGDYESDSEPVGNDPYAATRRAIVRAAAEIGSNL